MDTPQEIKRKRKGQTMAEFAITLPVLLLLVFGVIEFGRAFQAWVSIQNAARAAARYASTRQFDTALYPVTRQDPDPAGDIVRCVSESDERGTVGSRSLADGTSVPIYTGVEGFFATWYDGLDCEPGDSSHQFLREDIARIPSIWNEARRGAAGLALPPNPLDGIDTEAELLGWLMDNVWDYTLPGDGVYSDHTGSDLPSWFDVMICSSREPISGTVADSSFPTRYITNLNGDLGALTNHPAGVDNDSRAPVCIVNETPPAGGLNHVGVPWADAGSGGNTVTIVISFNHPLVTPLGLAPYLPLQARRSAIVESFQQANSLNTLLGGPGLTADINIPPVARIRIDNPRCNDPNNCTIIELSEVPDSGTWPVFLNGDDSEDPDPDGYIVLWEWTLDLPGGNVLVLASGGDGSDGNPPAHIPQPGQFPNLNMAIDVPHRVTLRVVDNEGGEGEATVEFIIATPNPTSTPTGTFTAEPSTNTPAPFACDQITVSEVAFFGSRVYFNITNNNHQASELLRVTFQWPTLPAYPNLAVTGMALDGIGIWQGSDTAPTTDTAVEVSSLFNSSDRTIPANNTVAWEAIFSNGPGVLNDPFNNTFEMTQHDFIGTDFVFYDPEAGASCVVPLDLPTPTPQPTLDPNVTVTPSWTPDCAGTEVRIRFEGFEIPGLVRISVTNLRVIPAELTDFRIVWVDRGQVLEWVGAGGNNGSNISQVTRIWTHAGGGDADPPTTAGTTAATTNEVNNFVSGTTGPEANWVTNYSFPPNSTTNLWIKFGVTATSPDIQWGMAAHEMNGTWFQIGCPNPGAPGGGGPGDPPGGRITIFDEPSPEPTNTPGPTNTDLPTLTPSNTFTPRPTNTPGLPPTITNTPLPSNTPVPSATPEDVPPDDGGSVCTEGCG